MIFLESETFWQLLRSPGHWMFEIFLMLLFDGILAGLAAPFLRKHWAHHIARDKQDKYTELTRLTQGFNNTSFYTDTPDICDECGGLINEQVPGVYGCSGCGQVIDTRAIQPQKEIINLGCH